MWGGGLEVLAGPVDGQWTHLLCGHDDDGRAGRGDVGRRHGGQAGGRWGRRRRGGLDMTRQA